MVSEEKKCFPKHFEEKFMYGLAAAIPILLSLGCFAFTIVLAYFGIKSADDSNQCSSANVANDTICENLSTLGGKAISLNDTSTTDPGVKLNPNAFQPVNEREYTYWLTGATGLGLVWAVVNTFAVFVLVKVLLWFHKKEKEEEALEKAQKESPLGPEVELQTRRRGEDAHDNGETDYTDDVGTDHTDNGETDHTDIRETDDTDGIYEEKEITDRVGKTIIHEWETTPIQKFDAISFVVLFFSCLCFIVAVLCLLWSVAISANHARRSQTTVHAYIIVEFIVAIALPIFLFLSAVLFGSVLRFITVGHVDGRAVMNRFLPSVKFLECAKNEFWVIEKRFYFRLNKKSKILKKNCCFSVDCSWSTGFLVVIIYVAFHLAISYFIDITLDQQVTVKGCDDHRVDRSFDCFRAGTLDFVDCTNENVSSQVTKFTLHCFRFYRFGVDVDLISSLATAIVFYVATVHIFGQIFSVFGVLLHIKRSKFWGILFLILSILAFIAAVVVTVVWANGYISDIVGEIPHLNIIMIAQLYMVVLFFLMTGLLLLVGEWYTEHIFYHEDLIGKPLHLQGYLFSDPDENESQSLLRRVCCYSAEPEATQQLDHAPLPRVVTQQSDHAPPPRNVSVVTQQSDHALLPRNVSDKSETATGTGASMTSTV